MSSMSAPTLLHSARDARNHPPDVEDTPFDKIGARLPGASPEIRAYYLQATDGCLGLDAVNNRLVAGHTSRSILIYRLLGLSQREIENKVRVAIEKQLEYGVRNGYEAPTPFNVPLSSPEGREVANLQRGESEPELIAPMTLQRFFNKYELSKHQQLIEQASIPPAYHIQSGKARDYLPLHDCFALASKIEAHDLMLRVETQLLRIGDFEGLIRLADAARQDGVLIKLAHLLMADFFDPRRGGYYTNYIWQSINALQRVCGCQKFKANEMLKDIAALLAKQDLSEKIVLSSRNAENSPEQLQRELTLTRMQLLNYAFFALRQTGKHVASTSIDSIKTDFVTEVVDQETIEEVRKLWQMAQKEKLTSANYAFPCLVACGIYEPLREEAVRKCSKDKDAKRAYIQALEIYAGIGDRVAFDEAINYCKTSGIFDRMTSREHRALSMFEKILDEGIRTYPIYRFDDRYVRSDYLAPNSDILALNGMIEEERAQVERYLLARSTLKPDARLELIRRGKQLLEKRNYWDAFETFSEALHKPGVVQAAAGLISQKNAFQAFRPLNCAICLPDEVDLVPSASLGA
jgi:hypothetical protein